MRNAVFLFAVLLGSCAESGLEPSSLASPLITPSECLLFEEDGRVQICHATGSETNPYVIVRVSDKACINGHAGHPDDFVAVDDSTCGGGGCLPEGAPCGGSSGAQCCEGTKCCPEGTGEACLAVPQGFDCPGF